MFDDIFGDDVRAIRGSNAAIGMTCVMNKRHRSWLVEIFVHSNRDQGNAMFSAQALTK